MVPCSGTTNLPRPSCSSQHTTGPSTSVRRMAASMRYRPVTGLCSGIFPDTIAPPSIFHTGFSSYQIHRQGGGGGEPFIQIILGPLILLREQLARKCIFLLALYQQPRISCKFATSDGDCHHRMTQHILHPVSYPSPVKYIEGVSLESKPDFNAMGTPRNTTCRCQITYIVRGQALYISHLYTTPHFVGYQSIR